MPGAPTGKGCDACRKQKKKCDQLRPACSRCQRLKIPCIGAGTKRYKWTIETTDRTQTRISVSPGVEQTSSSSSSTKSSISPPDRSPSRQISRSPSNSQTVLTSTLIDKAHLTINSDLRYNLTWAYGTFIQQVPRRLGSNAALDAAATSLALSHVRYSLGRRDVTPAEITAYGHALSVLRGCLDDKMVARESNTLCAIMLLLVVQQFVGVNGNKFTGHGEGAATILKAKGVGYKPNDEFESELLSTLRGPLLFEGLFNPKINFTDEEWASLVTDHMSKGSPSEVDRLIASWAHFPKLTAAARQASQWKSRTGTDEFKDVLKDCWELYAAQLQLLSTWRNTYQLSCEHVSNTTGGDTKSAARATYLSAFNQRIYSMALFNVSYLNCLIRAMLPAEAGGTLRREAFGYNREIVTLAYEAMGYRPLGSAFMPLCLMVAWFTPEDEEMRLEIEALWAAYCADFPSARDVKLERNLEGCGFLKAV